MAFGHPGGVRNSFVVLALVLGISRPRPPPPAPTRRPRASVPDSRGATCDDWDDCASAEPAYRPSPAPSRSLLAMFLIGSLLLSPYRSWNWGECQPAQALLDSI